MNYQNFLRLTHDLSYKNGGHDTQHNDVQHNAIQHTTNQHNDTQYNK